LNNAGKLFESVSGDNMTGTPDPEPLSRPFPSCIRKYLPFFELKANMSVHQKGWTGMIQGNPELKLSDRKIIGSIFHEFGTFQSDEEKSFLQNRPFSLLIVKISLI